MSEWWKEDELVSGVSSAPTQPSSSDRWWEQDENVSMTMSGRGDNAAQPDIARQTKVMGENAFNRVFAREDLADSPTSNITATMVGLGADVASPIARITGNDQYADELNRFGDAYQHEIAKSDEGGYVPAIIKRGLRGAARSIPPMIIAGQAGGPYAALGASGLMEANRAITEGRDAGLKGADLAAYAAEQGVIEAGIGAFMQKIGLGGIDNYFGGEGAATSGIKEAMKTLGLRTLAEIPEEIATEIGHKLTAVMNSVDPENLTWENAWSIAKETFVQTVLTSGIIGSPDIVRGARESLSGQPATEEQPATEPPKDVKQVGEFQPEDDLASLNARPSRNNPAWERVLPAGERPPNSQAARRAKVDELIAQGKRTPDGRWSNEVPAQQTPSGSIDSTVGLPATPEQLAETQPLPLTDEQMAAMKAEQAAQANRDVNNARNQVVNEADALPPPMVGQANQAAPEPTATNEEAQPAEQVAAPLPSAADLAAKFGVPTEPAGPVGEPQAAKVASIAEQIKAHKKAKGYLSPIKAGKNFAQRKKDRATAIAHDEELQALEKKLASATTQRSKVENAPGHVSRRRQAMNDRKAGKFNADVAQLTEVGKLPPALAEVMREEAARLIQEDDPATRDALQAIVDGKDADAPATVQNERERVFRILTGELDQRSQPAIGRGEPKRPPDPVVSLFTAEPDERAQMLGAALANVEAGISQTEGDDDFGPGTPYYKDDLAQAVYLRIKQQYEANDTPISLIDESDVTQGLEALAKQTKTPLDAVRAPEATETVVEPEAVSEPPTQPQTALGLTGEMQPAETVQRQTREAVAPVTLDEAVESVVKVAKKRAKKGKKTPAELDALAAKAQAAEPTDGENEHSPEEIADMLSAQGHLSLANVKAQFPGRPIKKRGNGYDVTLADGRTIRVEAVKEITPKDWDQAEAAYQRPFSPAERRRLRARGVFRITYPGGSINSIGLVQLAADLAREDTLPHEVVHLADRLGYFQPAEWKALVQAHSQPGKSRKAQGEDIARAMGELRANGNPTLWDGVKNWFRDLMARFFPSLTNADLVRWRMAKEGFWNRKPSLPSEQSASFQLGPDLWIYPNQDITSSETSINDKKLPAIHGRLLKLKDAGNAVMSNVRRVLDLGGGKFDNAVQAYRQSGVSLLVYDPFNRSQEDNKRVVDSIKRDPVDAVTISNVLNVIKQPENQLHLIKQAYDALAVGGKLYVTVYEGDSSGVGRETSKGFQRNEKLSEYVELVKQVFPNAEKGSGQSLGSVIVATKEPQTFRSPDDMPKVKNGFVRVYHGTRKDGLNSKLTSGLKTGLDLGGTIEDAPAVFGFTKPHRRFGGHLIAFDVPKPDAEVVNGEVRVHRSVKPSEIVGYIPPVSIKPGQEVTFTYGPDNTSVTAVVKNEPGADGMVVLEGGRFVDARKLDPVFNLRDAAMEDGQEMYQLTNQESDEYEPAIESIVKQGKTSFKQFALEIANRSSDSTFYRVADHLAELWDQYRVVYGKNQKSKYTAKAQLADMRKVGLDKVRKAMGIKTPTEAKRLARKAKGQKPDAHPLGGNVSTAATRKSIRDNTTASPGEAVKMTPRDLMKLKLTGEARGATRGYRAAKADVKWNQEQVMEFVDKQIPKALQGRVINVVKNANSPAMMGKAIRAINKLSQRIEAQAARSELRKTIRDAKKKIKRSEYKEKLKAILDGLKMTSPKPETLARLQSLLNAARTEMASNPDQFTQIPADMIKKAEEVLANQIAKPLDQMSGEDIRAIQDAIESLVTLDKQKNSLLFGGKVRNAEKDVNKATDGADGLVARHGDKTSLNPKYRQFDNAIRYYLVELGVSPETLIRYLGGVSRRIFSDNFRAAERTFAKLSNHTQDSFRQAIETAGIPLNELPDWSDVMSKGGLRKVLRMIRGKSKTVAQRHKVWLPSATNESGRRRLSLDLTKAELTELVLHIGDTDTEKKLLGPSKGVRLKSWAAGEDAVKLNAEDMTAVLAQADKIDPRIKKLAGELSKIVNEQGKSTGEVWQRMYGQEFELLDKYWPRHADEQDFSDEPNPGMKKFSDSMLEHQSHLKERSGGKQAIIVGDAFGTFVGHTARSNAFISKAEAVHDALRLLGDEKYKSTLSRNVKDGEGIQERLKNYIDEWQGVSLKGKSHIGRVAESAARTLISNFSKAALGFKPHIWAMQFSGITSFMAEIKPQYVLGALSGAVNASAVNAEIKKWSDVLRRRLEGTDFNSLTDPDVMSSPAQQMAGIDTRSISDIVALEPIRKVDNYNLRVGWLAAKAEGQAQGLTGDALMEYTAERTEQLIEDTQASWDVRTTSTVQALGRSSVGWKMFSMFASERLKKYNMAMQAAHEFRFDSKQDAAAKAKLAERIAYGQIANAIGTTGARWAFRGALAAATAAILGYKDEEEKTLGKNLLDFLYDSADSMLGSWAIAGDAVSSFARLSKGWFEGEKRAQFYRPRETPLGQFGTMLVQTVDESRKAVLDAQNDTRIDRGENKGKHKAPYQASKAAEKAALTVGTFLGLPAQGVDMMIRDLLPHNRMYDYSSPEVFEVAKQAKAFDAATKEWKAMQKAGKSPAEIQAFNQTQRLPMKPANDAMEYIHERYKWIGEARETYPEDSTKRKTVDANIDRWQEEIEKKAVRANQ